MLNPTHANAVSDLPEQLYLEVATYLVAIGVVDTVGKFVLQLLGCGFLDFARDLRVARMRGALAVLVRGGSGGSHSERLDLACKALWFNCLLECSCANDVHFQTGNGRGCVAKGLH